MNSVSDNYDSQNNNNSPNSQVSDDSGYNCDNFYTTFSSNATMTSTNVKSCDSNNLNNEFYSGHDQFAYYGVSETVNATSSNTQEQSIQPYLQILNQPLSQFRFRYESEMHGTHGCLISKHRSPGTSNREKKTFPSVKLCNFNFQIPVKIRCTLYQIDDSNGNRNPHSHRLVIKRDSIELTDPHDIEAKFENDFIAEFQNMGIIHTKKEKIKEVLVHKITMDKEFEYNRQLTSEEHREIYNFAKSLSKNMNLNQVCLCFRAYIKNEVDNTWTSICDPVYSDPINNLKSALVGELKICRMSTFTSPCNGGQEVFLFVEKVCKNNIKVRFYETDGENILWEDYGIFNENSDVHHQFGICLKTPPYKTTYLQDKVDVKIQLIRPSDNCGSESLNFRYVPVNRKRKFSEVSEQYEIPTVVEQLEKKSNLNGTSFGSQSTSVYGDDSLSYGQQSGSQSTTSESAESLQNDFDCQELLLNAKIFTDIDFSMMPVDMKVISELLETELNYECDSNLSSESSHLKTFKSFIKKLQITKNEKEIQEELRNYLMKEINQGINIFHECIENESGSDFQEIMSLLLQYKLHFVFNSTSYDNKNCLHLFIENNNQKMLDYFTKLSFIDVNARDDDGNTPLHLAVYEKCKSSVEILIENSSDRIELNEINNEGLTPLSLSVEMNRPNITKILIEAGCNPSIINPLTGDNLLHTLAKVKGSKLETLKLILPKYKNLTSQNNFNYANFITLCEENDREDFLKYLKDFNLYDNRNSAEQKSEPTENFDDECFYTLCKIFDQNQKWKLVCEATNQLNLISKLDSSENPTSILLNSLMNQGKGISDIAAILNEINEKSAVEAIDEMIVRHLNI